jgi:phosphoribosylanthranilate isomerase
MFRIKICGVTNADDARAAIDAGADALGFNFYRSSKRFIELDVARQIADVVPANVAKVGLGGDVRKLAADPKLEVLHLAL